MSRITQFNWSRHWKKWVEPHLNIPLVRASVEIGMMLSNQPWAWKDGPHSIGEGGTKGQRVVEGKLSWYQPWRRCHYISFFACAIGVLNHPELDWYFISGDCHTVPVGSWNGEHRVVMDILQFKRKTAEQFISLAQRFLPEMSDLPGGQWETIFDIFIENYVPRLRQLAEGNRNKSLADDLGTKPRGWHIVEFLLPSSMTFLSLLGGRLSMIMRSTWPDRDDLV